MKQTIVFYISGHGFGHASRDLEVVNAILQRRPDTRIVVRSAVPRWFLERSARGPIEIQQADTDTGMAQIDSLRIDENETARLAADFYGGFGHRVKAEAAVLGELGASVVVGDVPPLAFAAAREAGVPSIALANFTWDWIYNDYPDFEERAPGVIATIRSAYRKATLALRLPFHGGFGPMAAVTLDIPLIARRARHSRDEVRRALGLDDGKPIVLASFGGHELNLPYVEIARHGRFTLMLTAYEVRSGPADNRTLRLFELAELAARGLHYEDLVAGSDVVVSKPGYGIVSECIANQAALLYTSRGRFAEHDVFVRDMPKVLRCRSIPQEDLIAGRWSDAVEALLQQSAPDDRLEANGDAVAADAILSVCP